MTETIQIEKILNVVKSKIEAHNEFKKAYDEQLAFDFNLFNFFRIGENKVSEILAYFLDPKASHGQSDKFLKEFLLMFFEEEVDCDALHIQCEKVITDNRRIDIFIKAGNKYIAIENKIWAGDQLNQLSDYSKYLHNISNGNYLLLYLNPYGTYPTVGSIETKLLEELLYTKQFKTISYKNEIFTLIDRWLAICKADNVTYFIKQFKIHLSQKFLGIKSLTMTDTIKDLIFSNQSEIEILLASYNELQQKAIKKVDKAGQHLQKVEFLLPHGLNLTKVAPFTWYGVRVYKWSLDNGSDKIWIQVIQEKLDLFASYYLDAKTSDEFLKRVEQTSLVEQTFLRRLPLERNSSTEQISDTFLKMIHIAVKLFVANQTDSSFTDPIRNN